MYFEYISSLIMPHSLAIRCLYLDCCYCYFLGTVILLIYANKTRKHFRRLRSIVFLITCPKNAIRRGVYVVGFNVGTLDILGCDNKPKVRKRIYTSTCHHICNDRKDPTSPNHYRIYVQSHSLSSNNLTHIKYQIAYRCHGTVYNNNKRAV